MTNVMLVIALLVGCGNVLPPADGQPAGPDLDDGLRSGSRIKHSWNSYGAARLASPIMFDAQRNEPCFARAWADGKTYCTPRTQVLVYGNANCTQPLGLVQSGSCGAPISYFHESDPTTCGTLPTKIYTRGVQSALTQYWTKDETGCSGPTDLSSASLYVAGTEVPLSQFVELTPSAVDRSARITQRYYETSDGARAFSSHHDAELDVDCTLQPDPDGSVGRCVPSSLGAVSEFGDAACTERRMEARVGCDLPKFAIEQAASCPTTASASTFYRPGALAASSPLFHKTGATCAMTTARASTSYYAVQAAITLAQLTRAPDALADRRIQLIHYDNGAGKPRDTRLYDTLKGVECVGLTFGNVLRCLPAESFSVATGYFADAACQTAVSVVDVVPTPGCGTLPAPKFVRRTIAALPGTCSSTVEVRAVGAAYTAPLYVRSGVDCVRGDAANHTWYAVGDIVPLDEFVTATTAIDP